MGIATIFIILCHANGNIEYLPDILCHILVYGNYGVDIFLFVSGMGMFYSLDGIEKENVSSYNKWLKKRYKRLLIPYLLIYVTIYFLRLLFTSTCSFSDFLLGISTLEYWLYHRGAWFVALLIPLYCITPFMGNLIDSAKKRWMPTLILMLFVFVLSIINLPLDTPIWCNNIQWVISRVPIFILGYYIAPMVRAGKKLRCSLVLPIVISFTVLKMYSGIHITLTIPILIILGYVIPHILRFTWIDKTLSFMGNISLESYLTNIGLAFLLRNMPFDFHAHGNCLMYSIVVVIGIPMAYLANVYSKRLIKKL